MTDAFDSLEESEHLLAAAEGNASNARAAAVLALRALLEEWELKPRAETVVGLLEQAAETDDGLLELRADGEVLDRLADEAYAADHARKFIDAARARLANI